METSNKMFFVTSLMLVLHRVFEKNHVKDMANCLKTLNPHFENSFKKKLCGKTNIVLSEKLCKQNIK